MQDVAIRCKNVYGDKLPAPLLRIGKAWGQKHRKRRGWLGKYKPRSHRNHISTNVALWQKNEEQSSSWHPVHTWIKESFQEQKQGSWVRLVTGGLPWWPQKVAHGKKKHRRERCGSDDGCVGNWHMTDWRRRWKKVSQGESKEGKWLSNSLNGGKCYGL